jgi:TRAP-type C4-dicarboxylate transport system permease small subunit
MFRKIMQLYGSLTGNLSKFFLLISGIQMMLMIFVTTYGVVMRYFFRSPEPVSYEICTIFMLWSFVFAISEVERLDEHIVADIFIQYAPKFISKFLKKIIAPIMGIIFCGMLTWKGWDAAFYSFKINEVSTSVWAEPIFPVKVMIPICYALVTLVLINKLFTNIMAYSSGEKKI